MAWTKQQWTMYKREWRKKQPPEQLRASGRAGIASHRANRPALYLLTHFRNHAKTCGREFNITEEWIQEQLDRGTCARAGIAFSTSMTGPFAPSIDRIDTTRGYVLGNCQLVCALYNFAKNKYTDDVLFVARALVRTSDG